MRYRVRFSKTEEMRYTSHLDLHRTWERTIRRAGLPLSYSQGFNPRPKLNLAAALPLGITSEAELLDIWLDDEPTAEDVTHVLRTSAPPGIKVKEVTLVDQKSPKLPTLIESVCYLVILMDPTPKLKETVQDLLSSHTITRERRGKVYNLRPLINKCEVLLANPKGQQQLVLCLSSRPGATGRPDEVLLALNINPHSAMIHRLEIILNNE